MTTQQSSLTLSRPATEAPVFRKSKRSRVEKKVLGLGVTSSRDQDTCTLLRRKKTRHDIDDVHGKI
jgi:hypothetical protein